MGTVRSWCVFGGAELDHSPDLGCDRRRRRTTRPSQTTVLDAGGPAVDLEILARIVGGHQFSRRQCPLDERCCDQIVLGHLDVIESVHDPISAVLGAGNGRPHQNYRESAACSGPRLPGAR